MSSRAEAYTATGSKLADGFVVPDDALRVIGPWIRDKAERNGDRQSLDVAGRTKSYARVHIDSDRVLNGLRAHSVDDDAQGLEPR